MPLSPALLAKGRLHMALREYDGEPRDRDHDRERATRSLLDAIDVFVTLCIREELEKARNIDSDGRG